MLNASYSWLSDCSVSNYTRYFPRAAFGLGSACSDPLMVLSSGWKLVVETRVNWKVCYPLENCVYLVDDCVIRWTEGTLQVMMSSRSFCISFIRATVQKMNK